MADDALPFDPTPYDRIPISTLIYEPEEDEAGTFQDYRIVYGNAVFAKDWSAIIGNRGFVGNYIIREHLLDDYSLDMMKRFRTEEPHSFSTYIPQSNLHLHFQPVADLPAPYAGFFLTNITDYEEQDARIHFLRNIRQMKNTAVLMRRHEDNRLEAVYVSDDFARMMGCSREEALSRVDGAGFLQITHPEDRPLVRSMIRRRVSDDGGSVITIQILTTRKAYLWCDVHFSFIDDFRENYIYCIFHDVTSLKEYEEQLRNVYISLGSSFYQETERTLGLFRVNITQDSIEDVKGRDLYRTDSFGRSFTEAMGLRSTHYPVRSERTEFLNTFDRGALLMRYAEGRTAVTQLLCTRRPSGEIVYTEFSANLTRHPMTGDVIAFITETECNAEKVRETLLSKILAYQFDMVAWLIDGRYGVVIGESRNHTRGNIFPLSRKGEYDRYLSGQVFPNLIGTEEQKEAARKALSLETVDAQTKIREPYVVNIACSINGEAYYKRFDFYSVNREARFYVVLKSDTTEIHEEQERRNNQLREALEEARQANVAKTAFLSSMSHEIRTPMNAIIGLDDIALKDPQIPERTRRQLEKIGVSARHLLGLINDILDMSRIESGRMVLKSEEFSFSGFLEQINILASGQCQEKGLEYRCEVRGPVDDFYIGDDMKLKQVLINILGNAVKFTPAPGSVRFTVERITKYQDQSTLRFIIADTGVGMDEAYIPQIFEAFSQEDATATNRYGGSGLGMAITKNIVEMMNGSIGVTSKKGEGSVFTVSVTLRNTERRVGSDEPLHPEEMRVLVVDDDAVSREHAKYILEEVGIEPDLCTGGTEALGMIRLHHARREPYNLILMDYRMPVENGIEVTEKIREIVGNESTVIILSAYSWTDLEEEARSAGVDGFISKPLFLSTLLQEFRLAMERRASRSREAARTVDLTGKRILLAEDNPINAEIMMELLDMEGMEAEHAENGQMAVERFQSRPSGWFHAILMDVRMPVLDGLDACKAIRSMERPDAKTIPIIAMTANAFDEDVQRSLQAGMDAHLTKPVEPDRLYETLKSLIRETAEKTDPST